VLVEDARAYPVTSWRMDLTSTDVTVEDVQMTTDLGTVLGRTHGDLAVNAGFFDTEGRPLGLVVSGGARLSPLGKKLSGGVLTIDGGRARLFEAESFDPASSPRFAIQCRPRLVVGGQPNVRSDDGQRAERTALCLRDAGRTLEVLLVRDAEGGPSLYALGRFLAERGCEDALNLDGGPSTGAAWRERMSTDAAVGGGPEVRVVAPRRPIRQAIVFVHR
jgi:uncharacterized protein YigE (DUF2233 family)